MSDAPLRIGLQDVRASFRENQKQLAIVKYVGRPLGDLFTPFFYNAGFSANQVTYLRCGLMAVAVALVVPMNPAANIAAAALSFLGFILDCTDGNLARLRRDTTYFGKYIDGLADTLFAWFAPAAAGIALSVRTGELYPVLIGVVGSCASLVTFALRSRLSFAREWMFNQTGPITDVERSALKRTEQVEKAARSTYSHVVLLSPFLLVVPEGTHLYLLSVALLQIPCDLAAGSAVLRQARILLSRKRVSIWDSRYVPKP